MNISEEILDSEKQVPTAILHALYKATDIANLWARMLGLPENTPDNLPVLLERLWQRSELVAEDRIKKILASEKQALKAALLEQFPVLKQVGFEI